MKKILRRIVLVLAMAVVSVSLFACVPSNLEKAREKMAREGYTVTNIDASIFDGAEGGIMATDVLDGDMVIAVRFESVKAAKQGLKDWDELMSKLGKQGTAIRDGKWVYSGIGDGVEDFAD